MNVGYTSTIQPQQEDVSNSLIGPGKVHSLWWRSLAAMHTVSKVPTHLPDVVHYQPDGYPVYKSTSWVMHLVLWRQPSIFMS